MLTKKIDLYRGQLNFWQKQIVASWDKYIYKVIAVGRKGRKTTFDINELFFYALTDERGLTYPFIGPSRTQAKKIVWEDHIAKILDLLSKETDIKLEINKSDLSIRIPGFGKVIVDGADNIEALRGRSDWGGVALDEFAFWKHKKYAWEDVIEPNLSVHNGFAIISSTPSPSGFEYFHYLMKKGDHFNEIEKGIIPVELDDRFISFRFTSWDNEFVNKQWLISKEKSLGKDDAHYRREYLARFEQPEGLVYRLSSWHIVKEILPKADIILGGIDWGYRNPAALSIIKLYNGKFQIVDEWYETGKTTPEIIEQAQRMQKKWRINRWYADSSNPEKIKEANSGTGLYVIGYKKEKDSLLAGIDYINQLLKENRLTIYNKCVHTINEFNSYHFPEDYENKTRKEDPVDEDNHLMDAIRYAIHGYSPAARIAVVPRTIFTKISQRLNENRKTQTDYQ